MSPDRYVTGRPCYCYSSNYRCRPYHGYLTIAVHMTMMLMTKIMKPPMLLLPSCNYVEVDCEYAMYVADTHTNTLSLPTIAVTEL